MIFLSQKSAMKFTELTNNWYISVRGYLHNLIEYQKNFKGKSGFRANVYVVNGLHSENNRAIT